MEKIIIERPFTRVSYIETLSREFGISIREMDEHHEQAMVEIAKSTEILDSSKEEDVKKCLALLHILVHGKSEEIRGKYHKYTGRQGPRIEYTQDEINKYVEGYKLPLITALWYNDDFFERVKGWYRGIFEYSSENISDSAEETAQLEVLPEPIQQQERYLFIMILNPPKQIYAGRAGGDDDEMPPFDSYHVDTIMESYYGDFEFRGNMTDGKFSLEIRFQFKDKRTNKVSDTIPCHIEIDIITKYDNKRHKPILLDRKMRTEVSTIRSAIQTEINYSKGLEVVAIRGISCQK